MTRLPLFLLCFLASGQAIRCHYCTNQVDCARESGRVRTCAAGEDSCGIYWKSLVERGQFANQSVVFSRDCVRAGLVSWDCVQIESQDEHECEHMCTCESDLCNGPWERALCWSNYFTVDESSVHSVEWYEEESARNQQ